MVGFANLLMGVKDGCPERTGCIGRVPPAISNGDSFEVYLVCRGEQVDCGGRPRLSQLWLPPGGEVHTWLVQVRYPGPRQLSITFNWDQDRLRDELGASRSTRIHLWNVDSDQFIDMIETANFYPIPPLGGDEPEARTFLICSRAEGIERDRCLR